MTVAESEAHESQPQLQAARRNQIPRGIAYMVASTVMFAGGNAVVKWQLETYPLGEVAFSRALFAFLTIATIVLPRAGLGVLRTRGPSDEPLRISDLFSVALMGIEARGRSQTI